MLNQQELTDSVAQYKKESKKHFDVALSALLALAWKYKDTLGGDFRFDADSGLYDEALKICRELSDKCAESARKRAETLINESLDYADADAAWESQGETSDGDALIARFDMAGSHLLQLLELWIAVAFTNNFTKGYTRISIIRYLNNPFASGLFGAWGKDILKWGRGYSKNIEEQLALIGQGAIISVARYAEWVDAQAKGAAYYVRRRGSSYDCDMCESIANIPIPISVPFEYLHARCMCYPEYYYDEMPEG